MKLSDIERAGKGAAELISAANTINSARNAHLPAYETLIAAVKGIFGPDATLATLEDGQINAFFLGGLGSAESIETAKVILRGWERIAVVLDEVARTMPSNDIGV